MKKLMCASVLALALAACSRDAVAPAAAPAPEGPHVAAASPIEAGRYLVKLGGCNDCHTAGYLQTGGKVPESEWLTGAIPFAGAWGTSYPANLRLSVQHGTEDEWVATMRKREGLPPMPWNALHEMNESDLRAIYAFIKSLGPKGEAAPAALPPGQTPDQPYFYFMPITGKPPKG
jgi:mono/diheme cytochrome c family protein